MTTAARTASRRKTPTVPTSTLTAVGPMDPLAPLPSMPGPDIEFATEPNSPFEDGYSVDGERAALAQLGVTDWPDDGDANFARYALFEERAKKLQAMQDAWQARQGADPVVSAGEALSMRRLGALVDQEVDSMTLHTKEGYRLFMGRSRDPAKSLPAIPGGKRIASALKTLWTLTAADNPYADWALVRHEHNLAEMKRELTQQTEAGERQLEAVKRMGLTYSVLISAEAKSLELGFKSPYGYAMAELMVTYDYFIRVMKTLGRKNLISDQEERKCIHDVTRLIRRYFNETARFERYLTRPELSALSRLDYLPGADTDAAKRIEAAAAIFGPVPAQIYRAELAPRHTRRRQQITEADRKLLRAVSVELERAEAGADAAANEAVEAAASTLE